MASPSPPSGSAGTAQNLLAQAADHYKTADIALRNGDLATYQKESDAARDLVAQASTALGTGQAPAAPATTAPAATLAPS